MDFMENLHMMQNARDCPYCPKWFWCSMLPDECEMEPITEEELEGVETNGTYSESLDW